MVPQSRIRRSRVASTLIAKVEEDRPQIKYAVYPGPVQSKTDGDRHFIPSAMLIHLYQVNPAECLVVSRNDKEYEIKRKQAEDRGLIRLVPRYDGNYSVPSAN